MLKRLLQRRFFSETHVEWSLIQNF